jgi:hypothetical protein
VVEVLNGILNAKHHKINIFQTFALKIDADNKTPKQVYVPTSRHVVSVSFSENQSSPRNDIAKVSDNEYNLSNTQLNISNGIVRPSLRKQIDDIQLLQREFILSTINQRIDEF